MAQLDPDRDLRLGAPSQTNPYPVGTLHDRTPLDRLEGVLVAAIAFVDPSHGVFDDESAAVILAAHASLCVDVDSPEPILDTCTTVRRLLGEQRLAL